MMNQSQTAPDFQAIPKVDLHRHLEGSIRISTLLEIRRAQGMPLPGTGLLNDLVQVGLNDQLTFQNFLSKFRTLRQFFGSPEVIRRITQEAIADAAADQIRYLELRFTPVALGNVKNYPLGEVMDWVIESAQQASSIYPVKTRLIASINRHESLDQAEQVIQLSVDRISKGIVGVDLAGDEAHFSGLEFAGLFKEARKSGLHITIHAGEWSGAANIIAAILNLSAERIGHGVRILEDPTAVSLAKERDIPLEVCITSNLHSGVIPESIQHPLSQLLAQGLNATINTDDPSISRITLSSEFAYAYEHLKISKDVLREQTFAAARASFLPEQEKKDLLETLLADFKAA